MTVTKILQLVDQLVLKHTGNHLNNLQKIEQQIVLEMSKFNQPVSREDLRQALSLPSMDLINGLQSLRKRYLLKTIEGEKILFNLSPIFREYVSDLNS